MARSRAGARAFADRRDAGQALAELVRSEVAAVDAVVLALPRGGVPVAAPLAQALGAPLDVLVVRKLGLPGQPELAMGAIADVGTSVEVVRNDSVLRHGRVTRDEFDEVLRSEMAVLRERVARLRGDRPAL